MANNNSMSFNIDEYDSKTTLENIEYVGMNKIDDYKTFQHADCWDYDHIVYNRSSNNTERKGSGQCVSLTGPSTAIPADDAFIISVSLWDHADEIAKGETAWDPRYDHCEEPLQEGVSGKHGNVSVGFSVTSDALSATINVVMMINGDGKSLTQVYGTIKASRFLGESSTTRMLFEKSANEYVEEVSPQQSIPLTRPVFPVAVNSYLTIAADLWYHDNLSPDDQIALGRVQFTPIVGTQICNITGKYGEVQASISCD